MRSLLVKVLFQQKTDRLFQVFLQTIAMSVAGIVALILYFMVREVGPFFDLGRLSTVFVGSGWNPTAGVFNIMPMLVGSLAVTAGAVLLAFPIAFGSAISLHLSMNRKTAAVYRRILEILGGIPSVVFGFWGLVILVPLINRLHPPGASLLAGAIVLALMVLPTAALTIDAAFSSVPQHQIFAARALGMGSWEIFTLAILPHARSGAWMAMLLSCGRAIGETMAVLMVTGNIVQLPESVFSPIRTLTANIALELGYAEGVHRSSLFLTGFILILLIVFLVLLPSVTNWRRKAAC